MLFIPNIFWAVFRPKEGASGLATETISLVVFERFGQISTTLFSVITQDIHQALSCRIVWFIASLGAMVLYEVSWIRYFRGGKTAKDLYRSLSWIPIPLATLPIVGFLLLSIYEKNAWLLISVVILGIGHIGIHLQHREHLRMA
ncbi:MAG: hypothetical protein P4L69_24050 [Desulfosporosinus sp.]|nr:hypothetical protein [Desulfosporosinus sp.]